jgi:hypothetical protein
LLIAQLGMAAHAYSHLKVDPDGGVPSQVQSCGQCLSFTPLLGMVGSSHTVGLPEHVGSNLVVAAATTGITTAPSWPAFRSRAPPVLL